MEPTKEQFVEWGRQGGKIGGKARNKALTKKRKKEIAAMGAKARWAKAKC